MLIATAVTAAAGSIELWVAHRAASLFLVADATHLFVHLSIFLALLLPTRGRHEVREDVATCLILAIVVGLAVDIGLASVKELLRGGAAPPPQAMLVSLLGLAANLITAWLFRDPARQRWSFRAALVHELADASLTIAGLVGAAAIALFRFRWVDPGLSMGVAVWLLGWSGRLLFRRVRSGRAAWTLHEGHLERSQ